MEMAAPTKPLDVPRIGVELMMHLGIRRTTIFARFLFNLATLDQDVGGRAHSHFFSLPLAHGMSFSPFLHVAGMAGITGSPLAEF